MNKTNYTMTKKAFEHLLFDLVTPFRLEVCPYKEEIDRSAEYPTFTTVNLYYMHGRHVASWHKGKAWIFNDILEATKELA